MPGSVNVFLTVPKPGKYSLELFRAGESEHELIATKSEKVFTTTVTNQRVNLPLKLEPKDLAFAIEGVIHVVP
jgi:hypothetical protein